MFERIKNYLKDRWLWFKSFFTEGLVKTGQSFTTTERTLISGESDELLELDKKHLAEQEEIHCANPEVCFKVVGAVCIRGKYMYRVYCPANRKVFDIDTDLYELLFGNLKKDK